MAGILAANSACVVTATEAIANTKEKACWFGIAAGAANAVASIYDDDSASAAGDRLITLAAAACRMSPMHGPFYPACGVLVGAVSSGSVIVWSKQ